MWVKIKAAVLCHPVISLLPPPLEPFVAFSVFPAIPRTVCVPLICVNKTKRFCFHNECHFTPALEHRFLSHGQFIQSCEYLKVSITRRLVANSVP